MKEYKVITIHAIKNGVQLEVWLEEQLNNFMKDGWLFKQLVSSEFQKDALGLVIFEKEITL
jgi:hypothetical protein